MIKNVTYAKATYNGQVVVLVPDWDCAAWRYETFNCGQYLGIRVANRLGGRREALAALKQCGEVTDYVEFPYETVTISKETYDAMRKAGYPSGVFMTSRGSRKHPAVFLAYKPALDEFQK